MVTLEKLLSATAQVEELIHQLMYKLVDGYKVMY